MKINIDLLLTAIAPMVWGSTYLITTEFLPDGYPLTVATLRALPAGLLLLLWVRRLPTGIWWLKVFILGALNFSVFWWLLFISAYSLPGGVAATVGSIQPLLVIFLSRLILGSHITFIAVTAAIIGIFGVALLILTPQLALDPLGLLAALAGAFSMGAGTVLTRKWNPPVSLLTFTSWQLSAGGLLLLPMALWLEPALPSLTLDNIFGLTYLSLIGAALTYVLWFRALEKFEPSTIAPLGFLSPMTAVILGWLILGQSLGIWQSLGILTVIGSIWMNQRPATKCLFLKKMGRFIHNHKKGDKKCVL